MIESRKQVFTTLNHGSDIKHEEGDRLSFNCFRHSLAIYVGTLRRYKSIRNLSYSDIAQILGKSKKTVKGYLGYRPGSNRPISKYDFLRLVKGVEDSKTWNSIRNEVGDVNHASPADVELIVMEKVDR
jgi:hypothetical protein